jgi:hypothetical protein
LQTDLLIQMRQPRAVEAMLDEINRRYASRGSMLIDYPVGKQSPLDQVVLILQSRLSDCLSFKMKSGPGARRRPNESGGETLCMGTS